MTYAQYSNLIWDIAGGTILVCIFWHLSKWVFK
jgi:hypothetical protein